MPRRPSPLRIVETFAPDPERCAEVLLGLFERQTLRLAADAAEDGGRIPTFRTLTP